MNKRPTIHILWEIEDEWLAANPGKLLTIEILADLIEEYKTKNPGVLENSKDE